MYLVISIVIIQNNYIFMKIFYIYKRFIVFCSYNNTGQQMYNMNPFYATQCYQVSIQFCYHFIMGINKHKRKIKINTYCFVFNIL